MPSPLSVLSQVRDAGTQMTGDASAIGAKTKMVSDLAAQSKGMAPSAPAMNPINKPEAIDRMNPGSKGKYGARPGEQRIDTSKMTKPLGSFKKGGRVKKTGVYKLHAKERVLNAKQTAKMESKGGIGAVLSGKK